MKIKSSTMDKVFVTFNTISWFCSSPLRCILF